MAEYKIEYTNDTDRLVKVKEQEGLGRQMLHNDFTSTGGIMTFIDPIPPTAEEIAEQLAEEVERAAMEKAEDLIDSIGNLSQAKTFLKRLVKRLIKNGALP